MIDIKKFQNIFSSNSNFQLEKKICKLLKNEMTPENIFKQIEGHSDLEGVSRFLFNSGLYNKLLLYSLKLLKEKKQVSWHYLLKVFIKYKIYPDEADLNTILFHTWLKKSTHMSLFACEEWEDVSPEFQQMRSVFINKLEEMNISEENILLDQLAFVKAQKMIEDEEDVVKQLIQLNPANQKYRDLKKELDKKKALLVIQDQKKSRDNSQLIRKQLGFKNEVEPIRESWLKGIYKMCQQNPSSTKELALFACFCDHPKLAVELLENHINKIEDYWYYLEWTLETKQFSKGLDIINFIFQNYKEPKFGFSRFDLVDLLYLQAQFFYGLGKKDMAINCLKSISHFSSNYKNINYLLHQWHKESQIKDN